MVNVGCCAWFYGKIQVVLLVVVLVPNSIENLGKDDDDDGQEPTIVIDLFIGKSNIRRNEIECRW